MSRESEYRNELVKSDNVVMLNVDKSVINNPTQANVLALNVMDDNIRASSIADEQENPTTMVSLVLLSILTRKQRIIKVA